VAQKRSDSLVRVLLQGSDPLSDDACRQLLAVHRETRLLDFKETFDPNNNGDWCELIKDLVAMANTDGGYVIIGAANDGSSSGCDLTGAARLDQAVVVDKIGKYTDTQPSEVSVRYFSDGHNERVVFHVGPADLPIVFCRPGTYALSSEKQKTAFSAGTIYFRHGSKSEPARQADIQRAFDALFSRRRREILAGVRKVVKARADEQVVVLPKSVRLTEDAAAPGVRLTDDPSAPAVRGLMGSGKYGSEEEELAAVVRNLETDPEAYAAAAQLWRFYTHRQEIRANDRALECLLVSSIYRYCPPYYWASQLDAKAVAEICAAEGRKDMYPGIQVAVRLAFTIGGTAGRKVLEQVVAQSEYRSARALAKRLLPKTVQRYRVWEEYGCGQVTIRTRSGSEQYRLSVDDLASAEALIDVALGSGSKRVLVKKLDALVYGTRLERQAAGSN